MNRRNLLKSFAGASVAARVVSAQEKTARATRGLSVPKIKDVQVIETQPAGVRLTVVKIVTDQDGLYGYGCATFTQRADLVRPAVEKYLRPFLIGKEVNRIEDTWQSCYDSSYWKNGPVLNNAISGVDQALWDIKGRQAGMPVYDLVGGKCREAADTYTHAAGNEIQQTIDQAKQFVSQGFRHVRVQVSTPGYDGYGSGRGTAAGSAVKGLRDGAVFESAPYVRRALKLFEEARKQLGDEVELLHDVHERVTPNQAVILAKEAERFRLFYLEDALSPEDIQYFRQIRQQCATPIAMGELFNNPHEWTPLISERLIDYIRVHVISGGRIYPRAKDCHSGRVVWGEDRMAWSGGCVPCWAHGERDSRRGELQLRHSGILGVQRPDARGIFRLSEVREWVPLCERCAGLGYRDRREGRGEVPLRHG